jgi:tetratricopeptide (TPR) repeat protein
MNHWLNRSSVRGVCLLLCLLCCGAAPSWAAGTAKSRPASSRRVSAPAQPAVSVPNNPAVTDPCAPGAAAMQTNAAAEPSRSSASALASLVTRARSQEGASLPNLEGGNPLALELWSSRIAAPAATDDAETSLALQRLIRRVHTLTLNDKSTTQPSGPPAGPQLTAEPAASIATGAEPVLGEADAAAPETTPALSPKAQKTLEDLRKDPSRVRDPLETAELLFLSGRPADAVAFYEEALRRTRAGDAASGSDRAWILFQLGNCLRETDVAKAQDAYMKLIAEYPDSPWTEMARAGGRFLTWYQSARPDQLTAARKP